MIRVGVLGAAGRMGATVCEAVAADPELELVGAADAFGGGEPLRKRAGNAVPDLTIAGSVEELITTAPDVVVDFTVADAARQNLPKLAGAGIHAVVGTTGFSDADMAAFETAFTKSNMLIAANFAISAVLMMRFSELAAPFFETVEIVEYHHNEKIDAPSGTALTTAARIAAAKDTWVEDPTEKEVLPGARGGLAAPGVRVHAVRMVGMVAHQEVIFGAAGQSLTIRQDSTDRVSFMPGVILATKRIADHSGLTIGLDAIVDV